MKDPGAGWLGRRLRPLLSAGLGAGIVTLALGWSGVALTQSDDGATGASAAGAGPRWTLIEDESRIGFSGRILGARFDGEFEEYTSEIFFDPEQPGDARVIVIIRVGSVETGNDIRDDNLPRQPWFHAEEHPQAYFDAEDITPRGDNRYDVTADLIIRGISREVTMPFTIAVEGERAHVTGEITINRLNWDIGTGQWAANRLVGHDVTITVDVHARRVGE
jgi:polyisoprenoid-binding protein YceI